MTGKSMLVLLLVLLVLCLLCTYLLYVNPITNIFKNKTPDVVPTDVSMPDDMTVFSEKIHIYFDNEPDIFWADNIYISPKQGTIEFTSTDGTYIMLNLRSDGWMMSDENKD